VRLVFLHVLAVVACVGCSPLVRDAPFSGALHHVADTSLLGPFDGQIVDAVTNEPLRDTTIVGVWSYDRGDGLVAPYGSETVTVTTDRAGRYRVPEAPAEIRGRTVKLVAFTLVAYKRGYVGYRSDVPYDAGKRPEFVARHNRIALRKWDSRDSHAEHLLALAPPPEIEKLADWERTDANLDLFRAHTGEVKTDPGGPTEPQLQLLDARALLPPEDVRRRTGFADAFEVKDLGDLAHTHFYHGVHLHAVGREETWDVGLRVWSDPPGGLDPVIETFEATLPGVTPSGEITSETWVFESEAVRAIAFVDRERKVAVLLTCGGMQCIDIDTTIILGRHVHDRLDKMGTMAASDAPAPATPTPGTPAPETPGTPAPQTPTTPEPGTPKSATPKSATPKSGTTTSPGTVKTPTPSGGAK
jgi:hypothetical protein